MEDEGKTRLIARIRELERELKRLREENIKLKREVIDLWLELGMLMGCGDYRKTPEEIAKEIEKEIGIKVEPELVKKVRE